ncbi:MAG: ComEC/Rec2 family competence protein [Flavobacteriales bacterium]
MYFFSSFPFLRLTPPMAGGVLLYIYGHPSTGLFLVLGAVCLVYNVLDLCWLKLFRQYRLRHVSGMVNFLLLFSLGICMADFNDTLADKTHFTRHKKIDAYNGYICETPVEKEKSWKTTVRIQHIRLGNTWITASGNVLVYMRKHHSKKPVYGQTLVFTGVPQEIDPPLNPGQFDYKQYLSYHGIYHRMFLDSGHMRTTGRENFPVFNFGTDLREKLMKILAQQGLTGNEYAVAGALVLGITDQLDPDMVRAYASTGALHVLSVSGLHVGVLYIMLNFIFSFLGKNKKGKIAKSLIILTLIWFYALLTGLSPSVLRSATMFSFITVGALVNRKGNIYNSIAASAFVLLCMDPYIIMQVGFQLSYLAVLGIVYLYPKIYGWLYFKNYAADKIWSITAVSLSAQLITFPLGLLYYHQFPNYFFLSNLVVIPLGSLILYTGVLMLLFSAVPFVSAALTAVLYYEILWLNKAVVWVESLPNALYEGVSIGILETWLIYIFCGALIVAWQYRRPTYIFPSLICLSALFTMQFTEVNDCAKQQKLIIYQTPGNVAIDAICGRKHTFISDTAFYHNQGSLLFYVKHNWDNLHLKKEKFIRAFDTTTQKNEMVLTRSPMLCFGGKKILLVNDTTKAWNYAAYAPFDLMVIYGNPQLNLKRLVSQMQVRKIILTGTHKKYKRMYWLSDAKEYHIPVYEIDKQGAFILDLKKPHKKNNHIDT